MSELSTGRVSYQQSFPSSLINVAVCLQVQEIGKKKYIFIYFWLVFQLALPQYSVDAPGGVTWPTCQTEENTKKYLNILAFDPNMTIHMI